jgi:N-acylglucosamine-6-phosphate 2-epimerase
LRGEYPHLLIFADVSTLEEGIAAIEGGADFVSTAIAGYTPYSRPSDEPDFELIRELSELNRVPVIAEGRIWTQEQCARCLDMGAYAVVIGSAITRPMLITNRFVRGMNERVKR